VAETRYDEPQRKSGKIAVKVINHFWDEVLKVYSVATNGKKNLNSVKVSPFLAKAEHGKDGFLARRLPAVTARWAVCELGMKRIESSKKDRIIEVTSIAESPMKES
jgi:hypothetical protein